MVLRALMSLQKATIPYRLDERALHDLLHMAFKGLVVVVGGAERGSGGSKGLREGGRETCLKGSIDKHTYRRGLQAVQRRGQLITKLLQNHVYSTQRRNRICVLSCVCLHVCCGPRFPSALTSAVACAFCGV